MMERILVTQTRISHVVENLYQQEHPQLGLEETETGWKEERMSDTTPPKHANDTSQQQTRDFHHKRGRMGQRAEPRAQRGC